MYATEGMKETQALGGKAKAEKCNGAETTPLQARKRDDSQRSINRAAKEMGARRTVASPTPTVLAITASVRDFWIVLSEGCKSRASALEARCVLSSGLLCLTFLSRNLFYNRYQQSHDDNECDSCNRH